MGTLRIGVDLMGAETPPSLILEAAASLSSDFYNSVRLDFFGTAEVEPELAKICQKIPNHKLHLALETISMQDFPVRAIKKKAKSSLVLGLEALKKKEIDAFISCANTGAIIAGTRLIVGTLEGILRPALLTECPTRRGSAVLLDVGGSIKTSSDELLQHAFLGAAYATLVLGKERPRLALFNIGEESYKGTKELKAAFEMLSSREGPFEFVGNKEPQDLFLHQADVFVTGGFAGNIFVKTAEATARFVFDRLLDKIPEISTGMIPEANQAAIVMGASELVVKCHGQSTKQMLQKALIQTKALLSNEFIARLKTYLAKQRTL